MWGNRINNDRRPGCVSAGHQHPHSQRRDRQQHANRPLDQNSHSHRRIHCREPPPRFRQHGAKPRDGRVALASAVCQWGRRATRTYRQRSAVSAHSDLSRIAPHFSLDSEHIRQQRKSRAEDQRRVGRSGSSNHRKRCDRGDDQPGPKADLRPEQTPAQMIRQQRRADGQQRTRKPNRKFRLAKQAKRAHLQPVEHDRLVGPQMIVERRHDEIAAVHHLLRASSVFRLVFVPQLRPAQSDQENRGPSENNGELMTNERAHSRRASLPRVGRYEGGTVGNPRTRVKAKGEKRGRMGRWGSLTVDAPTLGLTL